MKLLTSTRLKLPQVYFVTDRTKIREIPPGVPFIFGDTRHEQDLIRVLEYEVLYQKAITSGFPFNWKKILEDNGFMDLVNFGYTRTTYMEFTSEGIDIDEDGELSDLTPLIDSIGSFRKYMKDSSVYVDVAKLKELNVFPIWLDTIEKAVHTNIHNFAVFNNNMYNKKLEGMYGSLELTSPNRNLIIIDISGSIPKGVSSTCLVLAKNLSETFYADLMITGSKSTLYLYEELHELNIDTIYEENEMDNDQVWFKKLLSEQKRIYKTAIVFGDDDSPCRAWSNNYNKRTKTISAEDGQKLCKWEIEKLISFHTSSDKRTAAYSHWFKPQEIEKIADWVKYLDTND